ncbi:MAG: DUF2442 domain-containing protein [Gomphosphaeria aponina SAG 52.96 = DSM 107014]|uniref:DUF2442 domain-containing protein n=1 Tax=Gomphosphaeria aponina SAG 52.96 = DSM 107014 TaxID=1521640 RepID=A0A941GQQ7_9CHRO|nr:DUF2442 domain-containing protein [Gomphosphaeria aponina SAG 52.96 = DSM 107014]
MDNRHLTEETLRQEIAKAREAAAIANTLEPRAESAYYDWNYGKITINLKHGATFSFPPEIAQGIADATPEDLAEVEITPSGAGLHWEKLDADLSIPSLLAGVYGNKDWMAQLQRKWEKAVTV